MKHIRRELFGAVCLLFILFLGNPGVAHAAPEQKLLQVDVVGNQVIAYFESDGMPEETDFQIAQEPCDKIEVTGMGEKAFGYHTIILVDNSLSVTEENRARFLDILREYIRRKQEEETVSIAVYGEDIQFLAEKTADAEELLAAVDAIDRQDRDTYLTDVMYELLDTLDAGELTRFIIISDGVDNKSIGITKEELTEKLKENRHQIFTVGHIYHNNEEQLENMFSLSRATNGREILLDETEDAASAAAILGDVEHVCRVAVEIPDEMCDGSSKSILFTFRNGGETSEVRADIRMPFSIREEEPEPEPEPEPKPEPQPEIVEEPEPQESPSEIPVEKPAEDHSAGTGGLFLTGAAIAVLVLAVVFLAVSRKKKKGKVPPKEQPPVQPAAPDAEEDETVMLGPESGSASLPIGGNYLLVLQDRTETGRIFRFPLKQKVIVGRNIDKVNIAIDYNLTVSGQHCEIYIRGDRCYINDLRSANRTFVNKKPISGETEITTGTVIGLGTAEFNVQILPMH